MGILNVTPDSFSDGGIYFSVDAAVGRAKKMVAEGADMIDVGGESSRPGAASVSLEEELSRVVPVIRLLAQEVKVPISIDTYKASVARQAIEAGAAMVNDISALNFDPEMAQVVAETHAAVILMHMKGTPRDMQVNPTYNALIPEIVQYLRNNLERALDAGVPEEKIIIDPGIGFGKTVEHNLEIIRRLRDFRVLGKSILIGTSRKSFIGRILDLPVEDRIEGTAATVACAIMNGADIVRVHDVKQMSQVARMTDAICRENSE